MQNEHTRHGACVLRVEGKRGVVFKIKYCDATGRQVKETIGREREGWTEPKARAELEARLVDVRREALTAPTREMFADFAREWVETYPAAKGLKRSTREGYRSVVERHLIPVFGHRRLGAIETGHVQRYVADALAAPRPLQPRTVNTHLNVLHAIYKAARKQRLVRSNPIDDVDRPTPPRRRWTILKPAEIGRVARAFAELAAEQSDEEERAWLEQARVVFLLVVGFGLRRGEVLGLRWRCVFLADPEGARLRVAETWIRGAADTPKSEASERTISLGPVLADELFQHRGRSRYAGDDERVFCHPTKGTALDHKRYAVSLRAALGRAKIEQPMRPFHDGRHTALTNAAVAGNAPAAIQARAGHADFSTTQLYIDLAGVAFRDEAEQAEAPILGDVWVPNLGTDSPN
jgi:integrase